MKNIKLTIEYDGTDFHGWQSQKNARAVQDVLESKIRELTGEECKLIGSSRTDVGVHALGHVSNFLTECKIPAEKLPFALNAILPEDVKIKKAEEVSMDFHARFCALGKKYRYLLYNSRFPSALLRNRAFFMPRPLALERMKDGAEHFLGTHDFTAFMASGSEVKSTERTITALTLARKEDVIELEIEGNGFLYNMVRIIAGTLVEVGFGKISAEEIPAIILGRDRTKAGRTAPSHGLYLVEVYYGAI